VAPASHDTASAIAAVSASGDTAFLSSGTWSLLGTEVAKPVISSDAIDLNFTNEGGVDGTTRLLKNVMGMWMLQSCRKSFDSRGQRLTYDDLIHAAAHAEGFQHLVDPDDASLLNPEDMMATVDAFCDKTDQAAPASPGAYVRAILESLTFKYRLVIRSLEQTVGHRIDRIRVIGGGSKKWIAQPIHCECDREACPRRSSGSRCSGEPGGSDDYDGRDRLTARASRAH
jgi:rhamnulokinase